MKTAVTVVGVALDYGHITDRYRRRGSRQRLECRAVCRWRGWRDDVMRLRPAIGPAREPVVLPSERLRRRRAHRTARADDDSPGERSGPRGGAEHDLEPCRDALEPEVHDLRLQFDAGAVGDSGAVPNCQSQLEVRRILVVGGNELPARDAIELLNRVRVAVGRAVLHDERPRQRRARQRAILGVAARAAELNQLAHLPRLGRQGRGNGCGRTAVAHIDRHGRRIRQTIRVGDTQACRDRAGGTYRCRSPSTGYRRRTHRRCRDPTRTVAVARQDRSTPFPRN